MRDLALAVIEGAVAAESLAKELRRTPDRSRHFQDIAERLRSVVGRASIRHALTQESAATTVSMPPASAHPVTLPTPPQLAGLPAAAPPVRSERPAPPRPAPTETRGLVDSGEHTIGERISGSPQLDRIEARVQSLANADPANARALGALLERLAKLEDLLAKMATQREEGERYTLRSPEEAIALAARLTERLRRDPRVTVRIEPA